MSCRHYAVRGSWETGLPLKTDPTPDRTSVLSLEAGPEMANKEENLAPTCDACRFRGGTRDV